MDKDLNARMHSVNRDYFEFKELPPIKWSRGRLQKRYRKITFGSYDFKKNEVRIHPVLMHSQVPVFVLDFVIYHELLHFEDRDQLREHFERKKKMLRRRRSARNRVHSSDFHQREKEFIQKKEAAGIMLSIAKGLFFIHNEWKE